MDTLTRRLLDIARERSRRWFPGLEQTESVRVLELQERPATTLWLLRGVSGAGLHEDAVVKVPRERRSARTGHVGRPRPAPPVDAERKHHFEAATLDAANRHFAGRDGQAVVLLRDSVPELGALVLERVVAPTLRDLLTDAWLAHLRGGSPLSPALHGVGRWLRTYHAMAPPPHTRVRGDSADAVLSLLARVGDFVAERTGESGLVGRAVEEASRLAARALHDVPLGLLHGDAAPRNFFVTAGGAVVGFDLLGRWSGPRYEDLGYLVAELRTGGLQVRSRGLAVRRRTTRAYERAFLRGYFGHEPVPGEALEVFVLLGLLDRWAAAVEQGRDARARRAFLKRSATSWLRSVTSGVPSSPDMWHTD